MLPFCANLVVSSAAAAPFILYEDAKARREIMKEYAFDQCVDVSEHLQAQLQREIEELQAHWNEVKEFQAQLQKEIDEDAFQVQEQAQAPSAVLFSPAPSDEDDLSQPEKYFGSKQRAQRHSEKSQEATHLKEQIAFAEKQEAKRSRNAQDANQETEEYVFDRKHRNPRLRRKAELAPLREKARAARQWKKENDRVKQAMLFGEGGWCPYEETEKAESETAESEKAESETAEAETAEIDTSEVETTATANSSEPCETSEESNDVARPSRRATPADLGVLTLPKIFGPRPPQVPKMGGRSKKNDLRSNRRGAFYR